jgi:anti-sigma factor RsiW
VSFVRRVLAATSGPACPGAQDRLVAFVDGDLDPTDDALVRRHVGRCPACREELARVRALIADLPRIAEAPTDEDFVADVLSRTTGRALPTHASWADTWRRLVHRPRFALELAYVATLLLCVLGTFTDLHVREVPNLMKSMISDLRPQAEAVKETP